MSIVRIRAACTSDLPALRDVFRRSSLSNEGDRDLLLARPEVLELTDAGITEGRTQVAVGADDAILGFITTCPLDACVLEIEDLFVDPDWMRTGVASRLVEDLLATASRKGGRRIELTANPHANAFYRHAVSSKATTPRPGSEAHLGCIERFTALKATKPTPASTLGEQLTMASTRRAYAVLSSVRST